MAAPDWMFDTTAEALGAVLPLYRSAAGGVADRDAYAAMRKVLGRLLADTRAATRSASLVGDLAFVAVGYRLSAADLRLAIQGYERVIVATRAVPVVSPVHTATETLQQQHELWLLGTIEAQALAGIAASVARLPLDSHDEARRLRLRLGRTFDVAIERAADRGDIDVVMALRRAAGALSRDLIERGRPLARITSYATALPLPSVVLAHELYQDAGRADQLEADNPVFDHPAFMPMTGIARSQ